MYAILLRGVAGLETLWQRSTGSDWAWSHSLTDIAHNVICIKITSLFSSMVTVLVSYTNQLSRARC